MSIINKIKRGIRYIVHGVPTVKTIPNISFIAPHEQLKGKKIIITGGGRGLGYSMAEKFIKEGADVLIAGRNVETLRKSAKDIGCSYLYLDVQDIKSFQSFIAEASNILNGLDCLVNNAGISLHENKFLDVTPETYDAQFDTNLKGAFFLTQSFMSYCNENNTDGVKKILFISSETSTTADERPYGLTKASTNSLVQGLAHKYVNNNYRINAIAPGVTLSDMVGTTSRENIYCDYNITKRYYLPEEVAEIACFLLTDASNILNGQILVCNEGKTINARWK